MTLSAFLGLHGPSNWKMLFGWSEWTKISPESYNEILGFLKLAPDYRAPKTDRLPDGDSGYTEEEWDQGKPKLEERVFANGSSTLILHHPGKTVAFYRTASRGRVELLKCGENQEGLGRLWVSFLHRGTLSKAPGILAC